MIPIGRYIPSPGEGDGASLRFLCDAPELERHVGRPWFHAWAAERLDIPQEAMTGNGEAPSGSAKVGMDLLARHACVCGATGSGKTRLALHLLAEQIRAGCSVVMLDPKAETVRHLMQIAFAAGMAPEQVTVLSPFLAGAGAPGWNPLDARASGVPPAQAAADVLSVLERSTSSWGPRMGDLLTNALIVIASHGLSLFELARLLQRDDYREALLRQPLPDELKTAGHSAAYDSIAYEEARDYFTREFAAWSKSERASAVAPVLNKFRELLRSPFLRSLLCARRTTLHLGALWHRPGLVLVHLDSASLGDEGVRMLGGLLAHQLLRTAMRSDGPVPVVLALDEMGVSEEFVGGAAAKILAIARSRGLRLLVACQHLAQLSDGLRAALLANTAVQAFFRLGYADAKLVASSLAAGTGERVSRIAVDVAKRDADGFPETWAETRHTVRDGRGEPIALSEPARQAFWHLANKADGPAQVEGLRRLARVSGTCRLYVHAADTKSPLELMRYVKGLAPDEYRLEGSAPMRLVVTFPRPRLSILSRETEPERERLWCRTLTQLPVRQAVLRVASGPAGTVQVMEVTDPTSLPGFERYLSAAVAGNGQSASEIEQALAWRRDEVERVASGQKRVADNNGTGVERASVKSSLGAVKNESKQGYDKVNPRTERRQVAKANSRHQEETHGHQTFPALTAVGTIAEDGSLA